MSAWLTVNRTDQYLSDLQDVYGYIELDSADAAMGMLLLIDDQVDCLKDPNFPRRKGRKAGTLELVAHPNYVVVITQTKTVVTALAIMHVARQYP
jgi:toxin ParE1/3/4